MDPWSETSKPIYCPATPGDVSGGRSWPEERGEERELQRRGAMVTLNRLRRGAVRTPHVSAGGCFDGTLHRCSHPACPTVLNSILAVRLGPTAARSVDSSFKQLRKRENLFFEGRFDPQSVSVSISADFLS